ncbi:MAG: hypothetical protein NT062_12160, partial [Proteobacteria bacterium]|nr:hypothetical protein [Pseudomonadota bacterium]
MMTLAATTRAASVWAGKMARELLRRGLDDWRSPARLLLRAEVLALIHEHREELKRLTRDETELLLRSALATGFARPPARYAGRRWAAPCASSPCRGSALLLRENEPRCLVPRDGT